MDTGRAGERLFLNVSLGLYARLAHRRERHRRRRGFARIRALGILLRHPRPLHLTVDEEPVTARILLVANNAYRLGSLTPAERERLDDGQLHLYTLVPLPRRRLGGALCRALRRGRPGAPAARGRRREPEVPDPGRVPHRAPVAARARPARGRS